MRAVREMCLNVHVYIVFSKILALVGNRIHKERKRKNLEEMYEKVLYIIEIVLIKKELLQTYEISFQAHGGRCNQSVCHSYSWHFLWTCSH